MASSPQEFRRGPAIECGQESASGSVVDSNSYTAFGSPTTSGNVANEICRRWIGMDRPKLYSHGGNFK